ncbi:MAG TPA: HEPN domain-containing protein [Solirubrobacteraceae bacterium]|jgi:HEPN domain-containing protein
MADSYQLAGGLLGLACDDEFMARSLLPIEGVTDAGLGFHTQQAVEKAVLALRGVEFPYTHDLDALLELCQVNDVCVPEDLAEVGCLSPFAVRLRYGTVPSTNLDRDRALRWADAAVKWARGIVEPTDDAQAPASSG